VRAPEALRAAAEISARDPQLVISLPGANGGDASKLVGTIQPTRDLEARRWRDAYRAERERAKVKPARRRSLRPLRRQAAPPRWRPRSSRLRSLAHAIATRAHMAMTIFESFVRHDEAQFPRLTLTSAGEKASTRIRAV
jgi:hypothetical protein